MKWKMKIPKGFQPTPNFCHIHQIKAQDGSNNGSPMITITPRANADGSNKRIHVEHNAQGSGNSRGTMATAPLADFEDEWVQIEQEIHYMPQDKGGYYRIKMTRISDGKVLINFERDEIEMYRKTATYLRSKYGIYRSLGGNIRNNPDNINKLLKNETIDMCDFEIWRKNHNPNPGMVHYR